MIHFVLVEGEKEEEEEEEEENKLIHMPLLPLSFNC